MAEVKVFKDGQEVFQLRIKRGQECIIGRAETCDIVLADPSISRQHLKLFVENGQWVAQVVSRFGHISHMGALHQNLILENGSRFYTGEFEFRFEETQEEALEVGEELIANEIQTNSPAVAHFEDDEKTADGIVQPAPYVRVFNSITQKTVDIRLTGGNWKGGRSPECQIQLEEGGASRNHFEIRQIENQFELKDLGSSNGTRLNDELLDENHWVTLSSGDIITVGGTTIEFQVRDAHFTKRLQEAGLMMIPSAIPGYSNNQKVEIIRTRSFQPKPIHYGIGAVLSLILVVSLFSGNEKDLASKKDDSATTEDTKKLSKQQQKLIEDTYNLADNLFKRGKYEAALIEIRKIHEILPVYKRSKELEAFCQQAIDIRREQDEIERTKQKEAEIKSQVRAIVEDCRRKYGQLASRESMERCLAPATEIDPENSEAKALLTKVAQDEEAKELRKANDIAYQDSIRRITNLYNKAIDFERRNLSLDAIAAYNAVIQSGLPDPGGLKGKAQAQVTKLRAQITKDIARFEENASDLFAKEKFKEALKEAQKALDLNPANAKVKTLYDRIYNELKKRLKTIYGDSVLEESLGNIEAAKQKWNTIIEMDVESGEYYQKAKRMLKKYGG